VTDAGLEKIAAGCPRLSSLGLAYCSIVTDAGLEKIAAGCSSLSSLNLVSCRNVTDVGLEKIAAGCPRLASLNLTDCNVTDAGLTLFPAMKLGTRHRQLISSNNNNGARI
jgi:F-box/leucine-rich repeat protein 2/20